MEIPNEMIIERALPLQPAFQSERNVLALVATNKQGYDSQETAIYHPVDIFIPSGDISEVSRPASNYEAIGE